MFIYVCLVNFALWLSNCFLLVMKLDWVKLKRHCHFVSPSTAAIMWEDKTTSGIYSTNIYSALTICQKLRIRLLTKKRCSSWLQSCGLGDLQCWLTLPKPTQTQRGPIFKCRIFRDTASFPPPNSIPLLIMEGICFKAEHFLFYLNHKFHREGFWQFPNFLINGDSFIVSYCACFLVSVLCKCILIPSSFLEVYLDSNLHIKKVNDKLIPQIFSIYFNY